MTGCSRILFSIQNLSYLSKCFVVQKFQESRGMEQEWGIHIFSLWHEKSLGKQ